MKFIICVITIAVSNGLRVNEEENTRFGMFPLINELEWLPMKSSTKAWVTDSHLTKLQDRKNPK